VNKRNIILLSFLTLALIAAIVYFARRGTAAEFGDPYRSVPADACFILESPDLPGFFNKLSGKSGLFREMASVKELAGFYSAFSFIDTLIGKKEVKKIFGFGNQVVSFHVMGKGRLVPLLSVNVTPEMRHRHVREILEYTGAKKIGEAEYQGVSVF